VFFPDRMAQAESHGAFDGGSRSNLETVAFASAAVGEPSPPAPSPAPSQRLKMNARRNPWIGVYCGAWREVKRKSLLNSDRQRFEPSAAPGDLVPGATSTRNYLFSFRPE
jgi:hypothetical protein